MTDRDKVERAPERIWAQPEAIGPCAGWDYEGTWHICEGANGGVQFVRADLFTALQAELDALREALTPFVKYAPQSCFDGDGRYAVIGTTAIGGGWYAAADFCRARAALHQTER